MIGQAGFLAASQTADSRYRQSSDFRSGLRVRTVEHDAVESFFIECPRRSIGDLNAHTVIDLQRDMFHDMPQIGAAFQTLDKPSGMPRRTSMLGQSRQKGDQIVFQITDTVGSLISHGA